MRDKVPEWIPTRFECRAEVWQSDKTSEFLCNFVDALFSYQHEEQVVDVRGSQTLLRWRDQFFSIVTFHQCNEIVSSGGRPAIASIDELSDERILLLSPNFIVPFGQSFSGSPDKEIDLCVMNFTDHVHSGNIEASRFFVIDQSNIFSSSNNFVIGSNPGFPIEEQEIVNSIEDVEVAGESFSAYTPESFQLNPIIWTVRPSPSPSKSGDYWSWREVYATPSQPNGRSGSPVFASLSKMVCYISSSAGSYSWAQKAYCTHTGLIW